MTSQPTTGRCQCSGVRFHLDATPSDVGYCHCSICRRQSGSAFSTYLEIPDDALAFDTGEDLLATYAITDRLSKQFCRICGTTLLTRHSAFPGFVYPSLGVLDDGHGLVPAYHQFAASKAEWYTIGDGLPQHARWPED